MTVDFLKKNNIAGFTFVSEFWTNEPYEHKNNRYSIFINYRHV